MCSKREQLKHKFRKKQQGTKKKEKKNAADKSLTGSDRMYSLIEPESFFFLDLHFFAHLPSLLVTRPSWAPYGSFAIDHIASCIK